MTKIRIAGIGPAEVRSTVVRFFCVSLLFSASAVLAPSASFATADCIRSEVDLRVACTSDTDGDTVTGESFEEGLPVPDAWVVIDVNDEDVDSFDVHAVYVDDGEAPAPLRWRVVGGLSDFEFTVEPTDADVVVELAGEINDSTDGRNSATIANWNDVDHEGGVEGINSGSIVSTGDGPTAYGLRVFSRSEDPDATARAINTGTIETRGTAARAMQAGIDGPGTAVAINEGSVTTRGGSDGNYPAHAVVTGAGSGGRATATNASGATITTEGTGALGLRATIQDGSNGAGTAIATNENGATITANGAGVVAVVRQEAGRAIATNQGTILTTGDTTVHDAKPYGLYARIQSVSDVGGEARAFNSGTIETRGTGGRGIRAVVEGPGAAVAINEGSVTTGGDPTEKRFAAHGVDAVTQDSGTAQATNESDATITTTGMTAQGLVARGGTALATNRGAILTTGDSGAHALKAESESTLADAVARAVNSGTIETRGTGARGILAIAEGAGTAEAINEGSVTTRGGPAGAGRAYGLQASAGPTGTARATNHTTIVTQGDGARGMQALGGTAVATNHGVISTTGGFITTQDAVRSSDGIFAIGDAQANGVNTGSITAGNGPAAGLRVLHRGEEGAAVGENSGVINASASGDAPAVGGIPHGPRGMDVVARSADARVVHTGEIEASGKAARGILVVSEGDGAVEAIVDGGSVNAYSNSDVDSEVAVGLWAETLGGTIEATILNGARIEAPVAARFAGGPATVTVTGSTIQGLVQFGDFDDTLSIVDSTMNGDIDFGGGADTLLIQSSIFNGRITGLGDLFKRGDGVARFNKDVTFAGSSATVEEGTLVFAGDFNLGSEGTMTVYDGARVAALLTDENKDDPPQITAGGGIIAQDAEGNPVELEMYLQADETVDEETRSDQATIQQMAQNVIAEGTPIRSAGNEVVLKKELEDETSETIGSITVAEDGTRGETTVESGVSLNPAKRAEEKSKSRSKGIIFGSAGALILAVLLFGEEWSEIEESAAWDAETAASRGMPRGFTSWASDGREGKRSGTFDGKAMMLSGGSRGVTMGFDARLSNGFSFGGSVSPEMSMSVHRGLGTDAAAGFKGGGYSLHGRWRGETLFAGASIGLGDWRAQTVFANPAVGGGLESVFDMRQTHAQTGAGARFDVARVQVQPLVTVFSGQFKREAHTAQGSAFRAAVPELSQRYAGWSAGMRLSSSDWLGLGKTGTLRWRPTVNLSAMRTFTHASAFTLKQSATNGGLGFTSTAHADAMPRTVLAFGVSTDAIAAKNWRLRVGYTGMLVDGKPGHGVAAGVQFRF